MKSLMMFILYSNLFLPAIYFCNFRYKEKLAKYVAAKMSIYTSCTLFLHSGVLQFVKMTCRKNFHEDKNAKIKATKKSWFTVF